MNPVASVQQAALFPVGSTTEAAAEEENPEVNR